jgi:hypothetical protein
MLSISAIDEVLRLIELRKQFDACQQKLLLAQIDNQLLREMYQNLRASIRTEAERDLSTVVG